MARYRAIVSIEFDSDDLQNLADNLGINDVDADTAIQGELDSFGIGEGYLEQLYRNGEPTIHRMGGGVIDVEISEHELDGFEDEEDSLHCGYFDDDEEDDD